MFTHYGYVKAIKNAKIRVVWGLGVTQGHQKHRHLIECVTSYLTLIDTMHLSSDKLPVLDHFCFRFRDRRHFV